MGGHRGACARRAGGRIATLPPVDLLTVWAYSVIVTRWDRTAVEHALAEIVGASEGDEPRARKRRKLVAAATELFVKQGYRKTSIAEVARHAGVAKGTVYLYFETKGELLLHAIVAEKRRHLARLMPLLTDRVEPAERLRRWLVLVMTAGYEMPLLARLMTGDRELMTALDDLPAGAMAASRTIGADLVGELVAQAAAPRRLTPRQLTDRATVLFGLMHFAPLLSDAKVRGALSIERFASILADLVVDGVRPTGASP
jgi:AcrR family transcriptional regulator